MSVHTSEIKRPDQKCLDANTVSFDIFDTFIVRACTTPDGVIERAFQLSPAFSRFPDTAASYVEHRRQAEARARRLALHKTGSSEVSIDEIYRFFPLGLFRLHSDTLQQLIDAEFAAEIELCRANPEILNRYRDLQVAGARTGFISDTYWSAEQLATLLRSCCPDLRWDFLYSSSQSGTNKSEGLFSVYLAEQSCDPRNAVHIGDNPKADIEGARRHGIAALHVPQASAGLASILSREVTSAKLLCQSQFSMLDGGMRTLRRLVASRTSKQPPEFDLGVTVLGPVMQAFDAFVTDRVVHIDREATQTSVAFLGRDGYLSHRIWSQGREAPAIYLEVNRRVSMIASAQTLAPIIDLLSEIPAIDADTFAEMIKYRSVRVDSFFTRCQDGRCSGRDLAKALPDLLDQSEIASLAGDLRAELMHYLRQNVPNLDTCSDLVLVDLGYSGSIQKALRRIFEIEGIKARIHGLYLLTLDDGFIECHDSDTFEGLISDIVVTPHVKRMLLRNIAVIEQMCCSSSGSVRGYRSGAALHEANGLTADQHSLTRDVQAGVLAYVAAAREQALKLKIAPFADFRAAASTAAATLGRLLLLPTDEELVLLGQLRHDVNLGTEAMAQMLDGELLAAHQVTRSLPDACTTVGPPMWLAGSFAALSPAQSFHYLLFGANFLPSDVFGDVRCGRIELILEDRKGASNVVQVACYRTGFGDMRIRIPMSQAMAIRSITVPIGRLATEGAVSGPFLQSGDTVDQIVRSNDILKLDGPAIRHRGVTWNAGHYSATQDDAVLIIDLPILTAAVTMLSIGLTPSNGARVLAVD